MLTQHEPQRASLPSRDRDLHSSDSGIVTRRAPSRNPRGRPFGSAGHRGGRPLGSRNEATLLVEALLVEETEELMRRVIALAKEGNPTAIRAVLNRLLPPEPYKAPIDLPAIDTAADALEAVKRVAALVAAGEIGVDEAYRLTQMLARQVRMLWSAERAVRARAKHDAGRDPSKREPDLPLRGAVG